MNGVQPLGAFLFFERKEGVDRVVEKHQKGAGWDPLPSFPLGKSEAIIDRLFQGINHHPHAFSLYSHYNKLYFAETTGLGKLVLLHSGKVINCNKINPVNQFDVDVLKVGMRATVTGANGAVIAGFSFDSIPARVILSVPALNGSVQEIPYALKDVIFLKKDILVSQTEGNGIKVPLTVPPAKYRPPTNHPPPQPLMIVQSQPLPQPLLRPSSSSLPPPPVPIPADHISILCGLVHAELFASDGTLSKGTNVTALFDWAETVLTPDGVGFLKSVLGQKDWQGSVYGADVVAYDLYRIVNPLILPKQPTYSWLSDNVMNPCAESFQRLSGGTVVVLDSFYAAADSAEQMYVNAVEAKWRQGAAKTNVPALRRNRERVKVYVAPLHVAGVHWAGVAFFLQENSLVVFDSYPGMNVDTVANLFKLKIETALGTILPDPQNITVFHQKTAYDCGPCVLFHFKNIFADPQGWFQDRNRVRTLHPARDPRDMVLETWISGIDGYPHSVEPQRFDLTRLPRLYREWKVSDLDLFLGSEDGSFLLDSDEDIETGRKRILSEEVVRLQAEADARVEKEKEAVRMKNERLEHEASMRVEYEEAEMERMRLERESEEIALVESLRMERRFELADESAVLALSDATGGISNFAPARIISYDDDSKQFKVEIALSPFLPTSVKTLSRRGLIHQYEDEFTKCELDERCRAFFVDSDDEDDDKGNVNLEGDVLPLLTQILPKLQEVIDESTPSPLLTVFKDRSRGVRGSDAQLLLRAGKTRGGKRLAVGAEVKLSARHLDRVEKLLGEKLIVGKKFAGNKIALIKDVMIPEALQRMNLLRHEAILELAEIHEVEVEYKMENMHLWAQRLMTWKQSLTLGRAIRESKND
ncbi:hypothetical protein HDU98_000845 [Podochytrium sp. JEL0797]|nr:hypothetical protein HDU98_000845 [Podochytrium sp. JEL0797]